MNRHEVIHEEGFAAGATRRRSVAVWALLLGGLSLLAACDAPQPSGTTTQGATSAPAKGTASTTATAATTAKPGSSAETPGVAKHMAEHFKSGVKMRDAVIAGDLAALKKDAQWMAEHDLAGEMPDTWKSRVSSMQDAAKGALDAKTVQDGAEAVAAMAGACGSCHSALGGPKVAASEPPVEGSGAAMHMTRHQWAAARMWEGLTAPSSDAWVKGAEVMADAPLTPQAVAGQKSVPAEIDALAKEAHAIAEKARGIKDPATSGPAASERAAMYGKFLQTCATCHQKLRQGPKAAP